MNNDISYSLYTGTSKYMYLYSPKTNASWAVIGRPVKIISIALDFPTVLINLWVPPPPDNQENINTNSLMHKNNYD